MGVAASKPSDSGVRAVDRHLAGLPEPQQTTLRAVRAALRELLPHADEGLKYRMPSFSVRGKGVAAYDGFKGHCSYFPMSGGVLERIAGLPKHCTADRGTLRFAVDAPLSKALLRRLVRTRLDEISDVADGPRLEFYDSGMVKAEGGMRGGLLHGRWRWYRADGTLMRVGHFAAGEQVGTWETWDRGGRLVRSTTFPSPTRR